MAISGDTSIIVDGSVYTNIDRKLIDNGKIFPEDGVVNDMFGSSVTLSLSTSIFGDPLEVNVNHGSK